MVRLRRISNSGVFFAIGLYELLIQLNISDEELAKRRSEWKQPAPRYTRGALAKFMKLVSSASKGAVTD